LPVTEISLNDGQISAAKRSIDCLNATEV